MKRVLFLTNYPSPYRVDFFNQLGRSVDLTVLFTAEVSEQKHRDRAWFNENYSGFHAVFLMNSITIRGKRLCLGVLDYLKQEWDVIISGGYSDPTQMLAFEWLKIHHIPFYMELDGGLIKLDSYIKNQIKRHYISMPSGWFSTGKTADNYLIHYGAKPGNIIRYPFTSLWEKELQEAQNAAKADKRAIRIELGIIEKRVVLSVGQLINRKAFDVLIRAAALLPKDTGVYIVGGEPTEEYLSLCDQAGAQNVHFVSFKPKKELKKYYMAADVFAMPTRSDIWGLVVNEALSYGLPVVASDQCGAALELIENGKNGYIVPVNDHTALANSINMVFESNMTEMSANAVSSISGYSIENMAKSHLDAFTRLIKQ
jgi:glycosyltransferase involved in cell wall biosynthesis